MPFVTLGPASHDVLTDVSTSDHHVATVAADLDHSDLADVTASQHHVATVAGDLNLADLAEKLHASLTSIGPTNHASDVGQAGMESEEATTRSFRPDRVRHSPGVAKAWCRISAVGALETPSYNVASVTDTATGSRIVVFDDDFSTDIFAATGELMESPATRPAELEFGTEAVGSIVVLVVDNSVLVDLKHGQSFFGDQ